MQKAVIRPLRIAEATGLALFMEQYLSRKATISEPSQQAPSSVTPKVVFEPEEILAGCSGLLKAVGKRDITPLLAKLYADQMFTAKQGNSKDEPPSNIPDLMLRYLNELNDSVKDNIFDNPTVQRDAKAVAWECIKNEKLSIRSYKSGSAELSKTITALMHAGALTEEDAKIHLKYLSERLRVIRIVEPAEDSVRFTMDPLAEYLGGLHAIDMHGKEEEWWHTSLALTDAKPGAPEISEFLLALRECCLAHRKAVPTFVISGLDSLVSTEEISEEQRAGETVSESGEGAHAISGAPTRRQEMR